MNFVKVKNNKKAQFEITEPGKHIFFLHNFSGDFVADIQVKGAEVFIFGLYEGKDKDSFNLHTTQHHRVGESVSDLLIKGVFEDSSKLVYEGLIKIEKGAQQSNAYQKNQNLVMSDKVFVDSRPFLEIEANDVRCTHGSTTGRLDKDQIFYLRTRGLNEKNAEKALIEGFKQDVYNNLERLGVTL